MRHGVFVAPFGPLADPDRLLELARTAEDAGWDGVFLWDHVLRPETDEVLDCWVAMAAMAVVTDRIALGPMVTPLTRRRPIKVAREALTLDLVSHGRLVLGVGLGVDSGGELSRFGEIVDPRVRGARLDEAVEVVAALLAGERVVHRGEHVVVDDVVLRPRPARSPRPPIWAAARGDALRPVRRAARYEGLFPIEVDRDRLARMLDVVVAERGGLDGFDVCLRAEPDGGPPPGAELGATWLLRSWPAVADVDDLFAVTEAGPPR